MTKGRRAYLQELAEEHGIDEMIVFELAEVLGESEDENGLVTTLEDMAGMGDFADLLGL